MRRPLPDRVRHVVEHLGQSLGSAAYEPAFDRLVSLHREHPDRSVRIYVGHGLFGFGARGFDALATADEPGDPDTVVNLIRMRAAIRRGDPFERLSVGSAQKRRAVLQALRDEPVGDLRWIEWAMRLIPDRSAASVAEAFLAKQPRAIAGDAVTKANYSGAVIRCGDFAIDSIVEPTGAMFLDYLRNAARWRGFPGFERIANRPPGY